MSTNYKNLMAVLFLFFSLALIGSGRAQGQTLIKPKFGEGELEEVAEKMEKLLQLKWNGKNLTLKKDWEERLRKKADDKDAKDLAELKDRIDDLVERGVIEEHRARMVEHSLGIGRKNGLIGNKFDEAFFGLVNNGGSRSGGGGGNQRNLSFSNRWLSGSAYRLDDELRFEFTEIQGQGRSFKIADNGKVRFKFEFSFENLFIRLIQSETGKTRLIWIDDDKVDVYIGDSFSGFVKGNPKVANGLLFPLFNRLGIKTPTGPPDP